ncbi:MAG: DUF4388 domain-containing protein [Myxococcota bacterium]
MSEGAGAGKAVDLAKVSPPRLLFALLHQRFTGTMEVPQVLAAGQPPAPRHVWFTGGMPVFTNWTHGPDVLGQVLLEQRLIDEAALMQALGQMAQGGGLLGQVLVAQGSLDATQLQAALRLQCARKLMHVFALRNGNATLVPGNHELTQMDGVNVLELMLAAVGRHYDEQRVHAEMGDALTGPLKVTAAYARYHDHFRFRPTDAPILTALQSGSDYTTLSQLAGGGARRVAQLVYTLWASQMMYTGAAALQAKNVAVAPSTPRPTPKAAPRPTPKPAPQPAAQPKPAPQPAPTPSPAPAAEPEPAANAGEAAFLDTLGTFERRIEGNANPFALLGLETDATRKDIRRVWSDLSRQMHPDALQAKGWDHLRERVNNVFAALSEANTTLSNKEERERIAAAIERGDDPTATGDAEAANMARAAFESEIIAKDADRYLRANKFDMASYEYRRALELMPDEPDYQAAAVWCAYNLSDRSRAATAQAEQQLQAILEEAPNLARALLWRGHVLRDLGSPEAAIICYERAYKADNRLIEAQRFIRAIKMSRGQKVESPKKPADERKKARGLKGLFGKR